MCLCTEWSCGWVRGEIKYSQPRSHPGKAPRTISSVVGEFLPWSPLLALSLLVFCVQYRDDIELGRVDSEWPRAFYPYCIIQSLCDGAACLCKFVLVLHGTTENQQMTAFWAWEPKLDWQKPAELLPLRAAALQWRSAVESWKDFGPVDRFGWRLISTSRCIWSACLKHICCDWQWQVAAELKPIIA